MAKDPSQYAKEGVDAHKEEVKGAFRGLVRNDFPGCFCNVVRDPFHPGEVFTLHSDGSGSKTLHRYLHFLETGDLTVLSDDILDGFGMNAGDVGTCGFVDMIVFNDTLDINGLNVDKDATMAGVTKGLAKLIKLYEEFGIKLIFLGGETADLPDQVRSSVLGVSVFSSMAESKLIRGNIQPGDLIWGVQSNGQAVWENFPNSGVMANGLTLGRKVIIHPSYDLKYPDIANPKRPYRGRFSLDNEDGRILSEKLLSPTRQWAIFIKILLEALDDLGARHLLHGISMNTGGGATKIGNLGKGINFVKKMPTPPEIFQIIREESGETWENMFVTFNCGVGLDIVGSDEGGWIKKALGIAYAKTNISSFELGKCLPGADEANHITLETEYGTFNY